jgi:hypothetical protein
MIHAEMFSELYVVNDVYSRDTFSWPGPVHIIQISFLEFAQIDEMGCAYQWKEVEVHETPHN